MTHNNSAAVNLVKVVRGHIVMGGVLAFTVGVLLAVAGGGTFSLTNAALFYAVVFFGDLSTHFSNDYFDADFDKHTVHKKIFRGRRILAKYPQLREKARQISLVLLVVSVAIAASAVAAKIAPFGALVIAVAANMLGWFYSAPPLRFGSKGLGEAAIAFCAGFAIPAFGYLSVKGELDMLFAVFAVPFVLYAFMLALSLEAPDIEADRVGLRKNISVRAGQRAVYGFVLAAAFSAFACFVFYAAFMEGVGIKFAAAAVFSAVPLAAGVLGLVCVFLKKHQTLFDAFNVMSLFLFNLLLIAYLTLIVL